MNAGNTLLSAVALATALAGLIVWILRRSFLSLLVDLCRSDVHGRFWHALASIGIVLTTLLGTLLAFAPGEFARWKEGFALDASLGIFRAGLIGLVLSLGGVALATLVSIAVRDPGAHAKLPPVISRPNA